MLKSALLCMLCLFTLLACEKQKQASAEVGAIPKQTIDQVTGDIDAASAATEQRLQAVEGLDAVEDAQK